MREIKRKILSDKSEIFIQGNTSVLVNYSPDKRNKYLYTMGSLSSGSEVSRKSNNNRRALEINYLSLRTIEDNILLENPINISAKVLTSDGGTRTCALNGVFDLLSHTKAYFIAFGLVKDNIVIDMNYEQDSNSEVDVPFGIRPDTEEYIYLQLDGEISPLKLIEGLERSEEEIIKESAF